MSELTANGRPVLSASITRPRIGVWHAELTLDGAEPLTGAVTLEGERLRMVGTAAPSGRDPTTGNATARVIGGAARLSTIVEPRQYRSAPLSLIIGDLLRDAGETLSPTSERDALATTPAVWVRTRVAASEALATLLASIGAAWRVLADGSVWVGGEAWPGASLPADARLFSDDPVTLTARYGLDTVTDALAPGTVIDGRRVSRVEVHTGAEASSAVVLWERTGIASALDRATDPLNAIIRAAMRDVLYHALIPCEVLAHDGDGTLQLRPDVPEFPPLVGVPYRPSGPGFAHKVAVGARALLAFEAGDPSRPIVTGFLQSNAAQTSMALDAGAIKLGASATRGVARLDDTVNCGTLAIAGATVPGTPPTGSLTFTYTSPAGAVTVAALALVGAVTPGTFSIPLRGKVDSASAKVKCE